MAAVSFRRERTGPKPNRELDLLYIDMWIGGKTIAEIGAASGKSRNAVTCRLRRLVRDGYITAPPAAVESSVGVAA